MTTPTTLYYSLKLRDRVSCYLSGPIGLFSYNMTFLVPGSKEKGAWSPQSPKDQWRCITHSWGLGHLLESRWQNLEITWWTWVWVNSWFGDGQGSLVCCNSWGRKESDTTERLNWTELEGSVWKRPFQIISKSSLYRRGNWGLRRLGDLLYNELAENPNSEPASLNSRLLSLVGGGGGGD